MQFSFDLSINKMATMSDMFLSGWGREVMLGGGGGGCGFWRKNYSVSVVCFFQPLSCRLM